VKPYLGFAVALLPCSLSYYMFTVLFNDGRLLHNVPEGEAKIWLMLSFEAINCNVFRIGGSGLPLCFI